LPANLTAEAKAKWKEALAARNPKEKLQAYQEFLSAIPKHKGNERLRAQTKTKIAALKDEIVAERAKRRGVSRSSWAVEREGAARIVMFGPTNAGRSSLLKSITNARPIVAPYDYTTQRPVPGMLPYEDIQFQLVELPAPQVSTTGSYQIQPESIDLIRNSDGLMLVFDLSSNPVQQFEFLTEALEEARISTRRQTSRVEIVSEKGSGAVRIASSGDLESCTPAEIQQLLHSYGLRNALVRIYGDATITDVEDAVLENVTIYRPSLIIANKFDVPSARDAALVLKRAVGEATPIVLTSCLTAQGLTSIAGAVFNCLGIIRIYTKEPNESKPSPEPFVVRGGTTVGELARRIHSDLADRYRYSRIWGPTSKFAGERVGPDHVLGDRDVVEIHTAYGPVSSNAVASDQSRRSRF
jgi:ribosome-interacting GTPase 1